MLIWPVPLNVFNGRSNEESNFTDEIEGECRDKIIWSVKIYFENNK